MSIFTVHRFCILYNIVVDGATVFLFRYGFVLPPGQIIPSGEEMWAGFEVVIKKLIEVSQA
jgi:hypothetical protein